MRRMAVLGCGPSGLLAAHAAALRGVEPVIFSKKEPSVITGAQYLHREIPGITNGGFSLKTVKIGTREGYAKKVYGNPDAPCSWDEIEEGEQEVWSMHDAYKKLWAAYESHIENAYIGCSLLDWLPGEFELVVSTIPVPSLCKNPAHNFEFVEVYIAGKTPSYYPDNTVVMSGDESHMWYRSSRIQGHEGTEARRAMTLADRVGKKPLKTDCDCRPEIHRAGRFGKWTKGVLVHHAYEEVESALL